MELRFRVWPAGPGGACPFTTSAGMSERVHPFFVRRSDTTGIVLLVLLVVGVAGCATYHPKPITPTAVDAALRPPEMDELRILASEIRHPILRPVRLDPEEGLSPDTAAVLAVLLNPSLRAARDRRAAARAQLLEAGLLPDPELSLSLDVPVGGGTSGRVDAYGVGLNWELSSVLARATRTAGARAGAAAVDLGIAWQEWQTAQAAKAAVYALASLEARTAVARAAHHAMAREVARVAAAVAAGTATAPVLDAARDADRQADRHRRDLERQAEQTRLRLRRLLGLPADRPIRLREDVPLPCRVDVPEDAALLAGIEARRLDLLALRRGYDSQEAAVREAILNQFPRITLGPTLSRDTDNLRTVGFGVSIELPIFNRNQGRIARERATRQKLFDEYTDRVFQARSDVAEITTGIRFTNGQIAEAEAAVADLRVRVDRYRTALGGGRTDLLTYDHARQALFEARERVMTLGGTLAKARVALELATALYEIPGPDAPPPGTSEELERGTVP